MAKVKDSVQRGLIRDLSRKFGVSENDILYFIVEMGMGIFIMANLPYKERDNALKNLEGALFEGNPKLEKMAKWIYDNWVEGGKAIKKLDDGK